jgi:beta-phosphoglucomutase-like phosphatase (HAD superfamily)
VVSDAPHVSLVCCDLASIVIDSSVVERAFAEAIAAQGIVAGTQSYTRAMVRLDRARGRPPADILREVFDGDETRSGVASLAFDQSFRDAANRFAVTAPPALIAALAHLAGVGLKVCLLTTLSRAAGGALADRVRRQGAADLVLCLDDAPRGFPWPDPVWTAMLRLGAADVRDVAVIGATEACMESGRRAGAELIVGLADGARRAAALHQARRHPRHRRPGSLPRPGGIIFREARP